MFATYRTAALTALAALTLLASATAQQLSIGVDAGAGLSAFRYSFEEEFMGESFDTAFTSDRLATVALRIPIGLRLGEHFALAVAPGYQVRGSQDEFSYEDDLAGVVYRYDDTQEIRFSYVTLDAMAYGGLPLGKLRLDLGVGPSLGYGLTAKSEFEYTSYINGEVDERESDTEDLDWDDDDINRLLLELVAAPRVSLPIGPGTLGLEARYTHQLNNLLDDEDSSDDDEFTVKSRTFSFLLGYAIPLGKSAAAPASE